MSGLPGVPSSCDSPPPPGLRSPLAGASFISAHSGPISPSRSLYRPFFRSLQCPGVSSAPALVFCYGREAHRLGHGPFTTPDSASVLVRGFEPFSSALPRPRPLCRRIAPPKIHDEQNPGILGRGRDLRRRGSCGKRLQGAMERWHQCATVPANTVAYIAHATLPKCLDN